MVNNPAKTKDVLYPIVYFVPGISPITKNLINASLIGGYIITKYTNKQYSYTANAF